MSGYDAAKVIAALKGGLIVSCQPVENGPMDHDEIVVAMALAAVAGGANGLRIEGARRVELVAARCNVPVIGIIKRDLADSPVRISPWLADIEALADAGAAVVAFDATDRTRPVPARELLARIHSHCLTAMADCSAFAEAEAMARLGCEFVASTMSGYTGGQVPDEPDFEMVRQMAAAGFRIIAEGRFNSPQLAAKALSTGAHSVTVGSAITRIEHITSWFQAAMQAADRHGGK